MACRLTAPSHYWNQCWLFISEVLWYSPEDNFTRRTQAIILYNDFEKHTFEITNTSLKGQWVKLTGFFCFLCVCVFIILTMLVLQNVFGHTASSKQKIPFIVHEGKEIADSHFCLQHLNRVRGVDLNSWLTKEQRAVARAFQMMTEDHLFWWGATHCFASKLCVLYPRKLTPSR